MIAYQTSYLKAHYPTEFMAALLTADQGDTERVIIEISESITMGIEVLPPSVNESDNDFTVVNKGIIRFGLNAIKGLGENTVRKIIDVRNLVGEFTSLQDFVLKLPPEIVNKKTIQSLAYAGAMDCFELPRNVIAENYEVISKYAKSNSVKDVDVPQISIFGDDVEALRSPDLHLNSIPELKRLDELSLEKQFLGMYVSSHPLKGLGEYIKRKVTFIRNLPKEKSDKTVKIGGLITSKKKIMTKKGDYMMNFVLEDPTGSIEVVVFPHAFSKCEAHIVDDKFIQVEGKLEFRRNLQVIASNISGVSINVMMENAIESGLYNPDEKFLKIEEPIDEYPIIETINNDKPELEKLYNLNKNILLVKIPFGLSKDSLAELKKLIETNTGEIQVELLLENEDKSVKRLKLSNKVNFDSGFEGKLSMILTK
jgi:DNA polymerase-3 subunit alpha